MKIRGMVPRDPPLRALSGGREGTDPGGCRMETGTRLNLSLANRKDERKGKKKRNGANGNAQRKKPAREGRERGRWRSVRGETEISGASRSRSAAGASRREIYRENWFARADYVRAHARAENEPETQSGGRKPVLSTDESGRCAIKLRMH